ncbi:hypothetical protein [Armatimonas sp.]
MIYADGTRVTLAYDTMGRRTTMLGMLTAS